MRQGPIPSLGPAKRVAGIPDDVVGEAVDQLAHDGVRSMGSGWDEREGGDHVRDLGAEGGVVDPVRRLDYYVRRSRLAAWDDEALRR